MRKTLISGRTLVNGSDLYIGNSSNSPIQIARVNQIPAAYTHPSAIQCSAATEIDSLKSSVSSGKALIASAVTDKGIGTSSSASFSTMASNIRNLDVITSSQEEMLNGWTYSASGSSSRSYSPTMTGTAIFSRSTDSWTEYLTPRVPSSMNTYSTLCYLSYNGNIWSDRLCILLPTATFDGSYLTLSGTNRCSPEMSGVSRTYSYTIVNYTPSLIQVRIPSCSWTYNGVTYRITCSNAVITMRLSYSVFANPPSSSISIPGSSISYRY